MKERRSGGEGGRYERKNEVGILVSQMLQDADTKPLSIKIEIFHICVCVCTLVCVFVCVCKKFLISTFSNNNKYSDRSMGSET